MSNPTNEWNRQLEEACRDFEAGTISFEAAGTKVHQALMYIASGLDDGTVTAAESETLQKLVDKVQAAQDRQLIVLRKKARALRKQFRV